MFKNTVGVTKARLFLVTIWLVSVFLSQASVALGDTVLTINDFTNQSKEPIQLSEPVTKKEFDNYINETYRNRSFLDVAITCHDYLVENGFNYHQGGLIYPLDASKGTGVDCSGYVGWCIYEYQDGNFSCQSSKWYLRTAKKLYAGEESEDPEYTKGWTAVKGWENFEPGDILCYPDHVHIYLMKDPENEERYLVLNCGKHSSLREYSTNISERYFSQAEYAIRIP